MPREMKEVNELGEGSIISVEEEPCKISKISSSMPGKHGHAKYSIEVEGIFDGKKRHIKETSESKVEIPDVEVKKGQVISLSGDSAQLMDMSSYDTFEISVPEEIQGELEEGQEIKYIEAMGRRKIQTE